MEAQRQQVNAIGIEAHPFVYWVAQTKVRWNVDLNAVAAIYQRVI